MQKCPLIHPPNPSKPLHAPLIVSLPLYLCNPGIPFPPKHPSTPSTISAILQTLLQPLTLVQFLYCPVHACATLCLQGIINKVRNPFPCNRPKDGFVPPPVPEAPVKPKLQVPPGSTYWDVLKQYNDAGLMDMKQLDASIISDLDTLPQPQAIRAVEAYAAADFSNIRNPCGFMKTIINSLKMEESAEGKADDVVLAPMVQLHLDSAVQKGIIGSHQVQ